MRIHIFVVISVSHVLFSLSRLDIEDRWSDDLMRHRNRSSEGEDTLFTHASTPFLEIDNISCIGHKQ